MRTSARITLTIVLLAVASAIGLVAYQAGLDAGIASADGTDVVRVVGGGWRGGPGFFPGFLFVPFVFFGLFALARFTVGGWGRGRDRGWGGPPHDWDRRAQDWHRDQHAEHSPTTDARDTGNWPEGRS